MYQLFYITPSENTCLYEAPSLSGSSPQHQLLHSFPANLHRYLTQQSPISIPLCTTEAHRLHTVT
jgi:hypothetical protein